MGEDGDSVDDLAEESGRQAPLAHRRAFCLQIKNLCKREHGKPCIDNISLDVFQGEFICLIGPPGCGKTLLLDLIAGVQTPCEGRIILKGDDISMLPAGQRKLGQLRRSDRLRPGLKLRKNIAQGLQHARLSRADIKQRVAGLLEQFSLAELGAAYPAQMSPAQQISALLARAIAAGPELLLLVDPLQRFSRQERRALRRDLKALQRRLGVAFLMVTGDRSEALALADRIVVLNEGAISQIGTPARLYQEPDNLFVARFIGRVNLFEGIVEAPDAVFVCERSFGCREHALGRGSDCIAMIRPEDIVPLGPALQAQEEGAGEMQIDGAGSQNCLELLIEDMEYCGPLWRVRLTGDMIDEALWADFSAHSVRRMGLASGQMVQVKLPASRLRVIADTPEA